MKIVSWNASQKFREKVKLFDPKAIDVLVVQECENTELSAEMYKEAGWDFHWMGQNKHKGLGIFVPVNNTIEPLNWSITGCYYFLPVKISNDLVILGVWTKGGKSKSVSYAAQVTRFLDSYIQNIDAERTILIGDFNSSFNFDKKRDKHHNHTKNTSRLAEIGLESLYHFQTKEEQGSEAKSTFYMYRHQDKPYHIDYAYLPKPYLESASIEIGRPSDWLQHSDHVPLFIELHAQC